MYAKKTIVRPARNAGNSRTCRTLPGFQRHERMPILRVHDQYAQAKAMKSKTTTTLMKTITVLKRADSLMPAHEECTITARTTSTRRKG